MIDIRQVRVVVKRQAGREIVTPDTLEVLLGRLQQQTPAVRDIIEPGPLAFPVFHNTVYFLAGENGEYDILDEHSNPHYVNNEVVLFRKEVDQAYWHKIVLYRGDQELLHDINDPAYHRAGEEEDYGKFFRFNPDTGAVEYIKVYLLPEATEGQIAIKGEEEWKAKNTEPLPTEDLPTEDLPFRFEHKTYGLLYFEE